jgi:hypothetical protein
MMTHTVPQTILAQLGGRKFLAMTGAYSLTGSADALSMRLPRGPNGARVGGVRITLDPNDTYTVVTFKLRGMKIVESFKESGIYCDMLAETFTEATGLYISL